MNIPHLAIANWAKVCILVGCLAGAIFAQGKEAKIGKGYDLNESKGYDLKGAIGFEKSYSPQKGDQEFLKGFPLLLKEKKTGAVLGRTTTDADGKFVFANVTGSGANPMNARQMCNEKGDCFDFQPLKPDEPPPLEPIIVDDPPLQVKRESRPRPKLVLGVVTCTPHGGGTAMRMRIILDDKGPRRPAYK